ncbi:MAG: Oligoribonuclease, mitochondrial [Trizodia sp. TS-e1964]|nr:MAG: Oligoribonuclease, mitochondrial [Trizodia sp. TS-e1964]
MDRSTAPLVWIDCEMTGLDPTSDTILQIACFITSPTLTLLTPTGFTTTIHHTPHALSLMSPWCQHTHSATGLSAAALASTTTAASAALALLEFITLHVPTPGVALLAGNSVHADKAFLAREPFAKVLAHLHYRILDVSSIKEAARRWAPEEVLARVPVKRGRHEAVEDILESIAEARFYMETFLGGRGG